MIIKSLSLQFGVKHFNMYMPYSWRSVWCKCHVTA